MKLLSSISPVEHEIPFNTFIHLFSLSSANGFIEQILSPLLIIKQEFSPRHEYCAHILRLSLTVLP